MYATGLVRELRDTFPCVATFECIRKRGACGWHLTWFRLVLGESRWFVRVQPCLRGSDIRVVLAPYCQVSHVGADPGHKVRVARVETIPSHLVYCAVVGVVSGLS